MRCEGLRCLPVEGGSQCFDISLSLRQTGDFPFDAATTLKDTAVVAPAEEGADLVERLLAFVAK